ncbi:MAG: methionine--tRNA ligase [Sandaracinaceae bacterium]|nr:methionine--tRNA ligase [Sandaracinaceae bacterium]
MKPFYVTTPIYYVNDKPHIGHAYSTAAADMLARYHRLRGQPTRFLTGLDEHGLKIERRAQELGQEPQAFVDSMVPPFEEAWQQLDITHDDFIRTTSARHKEAVQRLWKMLEAKGDIYLADYEDWYCVGCESFKTEKELLPGNLCPDHKKPVEKIKEQSYFFRLSAYAEPLLRYFDAHPDFVKPEGRFNEVKSFVRAGLRDLSVSRSSFSWGIPVPEQPEHVMYVWLDALTNYISALGGPAEPGVAPLYDQFWGEDANVIHIVGKDILRFHTIYWPAFLMSAGIRLPSQVWAHGWLTVNGEKMSKGLGNFLPPAPLVEAFGADVLRYYFLREVSFGQDGDFNHKNLIARYNNELGNGLGNLLNRILPFLKKFDGKVPDVGPLEGADAALASLAEGLAAQVRDNLDAVQLNRALDAIKELIDAANKYVNDEEPWNLSKSDETLGRLAQVAYVTLECVRFLSVMLAPVMPNKANELRAQLGLGALEPQVGVDAWPSRFGELPAGTAVVAGKPVFPKIDAKQEEALLARLVPVPEGVEGDAEKSSGADKKSAKKAPKGQADSGGAGAPSGADAAEGGVTDGPTTIEFDDFAKVDLRVGLVLTAEKVPKKDRLLRLEVDLGEPAPRQIVAGIAEHFTPEQMVGRRVVVVANLAPRKLAGLVSQGMVLATNTPTGLQLLAASDDVPPGTPAK